MPRFFFHIFDDTVSMDEAGQASEDLDAAREIALNGARELVCEQIRRGYLNLEHYIVVADQMGKEHFRVIFREAFVVHRKTRNDKNPGLAKFWEIRERTYSVLV